MSPSSDKALYLLRFDHRHSYADGLFGFKRTLSAPQREEVIDSKRLIFEGFTQALAEGVPTEDVAILVDEEFGADILSDAHRGGFITKQCLSSKAALTISILNTATTLRATSKPLTQASPRFW